MALIKVISEDLSENIYDVNVPIVVSGVSTAGASYAITMATGQGTLDITNPVGTVTMNTRSYIKNMNELIEEAIADPYAIPTFTQVYNAEADAYLAPVEYHTILTQGTTP